MNMKNGANDHEGYGQTCFAIIIDVCFTLLINKVVLENISHVLHNKVKVQCKLTGNHLFLYMDTYLGLVEVSFVFSKMFRMSPANF